MTAAGHHLDVTRGARARRRVLAVLMAGAVLAAETAPAGQAVGEDFARRQYESGAAFMKSGRYTEAVKDFMAVLDSFPKSSVADDALLQLALYYLDQTRDLDASQALLDRLIREYPNTDATPFAHVAAGRLTVSRGLTPANVEAALASFERVPRLFPNNEAVPAAIFFAAETLRALQRIDEALQLYRRVALEHPRSIWEARARLGAGTCLALSNRPTGALEELQRVRQQLPGSPEAATALSLNTILYRLHVRAPTRPAYAFKDPHPMPAKTRFDDVIGLAVDSFGHLLVGHKDGLSILDSSGVVQRSVVAESPSAFFVDERGQLATIRREVVTIDGAETSVTVPTGGDSMRKVEDIPHAVALSSGDRLVIDRRAKKVIRVSASGTFLRDFADVDAERLALDGFENVAIVDRDTKSVALFSRDGVEVARIPRKGAGYEFGNPVDVAFDLLGHVFVLDRERASVFVFRTRGGKSELMTTIGGDERAAGAFQRPSALALDAAGRVYIYDERARQILVYQ